MAACARLYHTESRALILGARSCCAEYQFPFPITWFAVTHLFKTSPESATVKVLASMLLYTLWHGVLVYLVFRFAGWEWSAVSGTLLPFSGVYFLHFWERLTEAFRQASYVLQLPFRRRLRARLIRERDTIRNEIEILAQTL